VEERLRRIERKKKKKNKAKEKQERQTMPGKPIFDLAGNIITTTVPSVEQTGSTKPWTTHTPDNGLGKSPGSVPSPTTSSTDDVKIQDTTLSPEINNPDKNVSTREKPSTTTKGTRDPPVSPVTPGSAGEGVSNLSTQSPTQVDLTKNIQDNVNLNVKNITNTNKGDSTHINIVINLGDKNGRNKEKKKDKWRRKQARRLKCPSQGKI
jgi:hypothetical protein